MMRQTIVFVLMIVFTGSFAMATPDLGTTPKDTKTNNHVGMNPGTPDGREGGEDIATAVIIGSLPFDDTGNTSNNVNDYDAICPYSDSTAPDVVYSYSPTFDETIQVDLCGSGYDTKTYIFDSAMNIIACNDDEYYDDTCGNYVSLIEEAPLVAGETYYIIIDGYGADSGDYVLNVMAFIPPPPCILDCEDDEGEPEIVDGYYDAFNSGCGGPEFGNPYSEFHANNAGELVYGGVTGYYITSSGGSSRDTDWFLATMGSGGIIEWTLDAEQETYGFLLGPNDCNAVAVVDQMLVGPCASMTMGIQGTPGDIVWLWIGPSDFEAPPGFVGHEYKYLCTFTGLLDEPVATEKVTFEGIKSLYR